MAGNVIASRLRFLLNAQKWNRPALLDQITLAAPAIPSGADLQVELFLTLDGTNPFDFTNVASVTVELSARQNPLNNNVIFSGTVAVANITTAATLANFNNGAGNATGQQLTLIIPNANTQLGLSSSSTNYTLAIYATSTDATPRQQPLLVQDVVVVDADLPQGNPSLPVTFKAGSKLSFVCSDGQTRDVNFVLLANGKWTLDIGQAGYNGPGQAVYSLFCGDGNYRDLTLISNQGVWALDVGQNGHS